jgi:hypothetical protein
MSLSIQRKSSSEATQEPLVYVSAAISSSIENQSSSEANSSMAGDRLMSARHPGEEESRRSK